MTDSSDRRRDPSAWVSPVVSAGGRMPCVVNVGLPRTGTTSLCEATSFLGYRALHIWDAAEHDAAVLAGFVAGEARYREFVSGYHVLADTPFYVLREVFERDFPDTLILCTTRPRSDWVRSMLRSGVAGGRFLAEHYRMPSYPYGPADSASLERMFDAHHERVCRGLPTIDLGDPDDRAKWELLCSALPRSVECLERARDLSWPHENRSVR